MFRLLLTLLLIVLVVTAKQVNGASIERPFIGVNANTLYQTILNQSSNVQDKLQTGATTNIRHHLLYNICSERLVQLRRTGRKGVRAKGRMGKNMSFSKLRFVSTPRNTIIIKAVHSDLHICFNQRGKLIARRKHKQVGCEFTELYSTDGKLYTQYVSANTKHAWLIGFNEKGKPVRGNSRVTVPEKCFNFLKMDDDKKPKCKKSSGIGPSGVNFCDSFFYQFAKDSRTLNMKRNKVRHTKHHRRRRKG